MCGIFGIVNKDGNADADIVTRMTNLVAHRGPDGQGVLVRGNVGLGHRRLAVIDLSKEGAQPMRSITHPVWIVFNGEIYNYRELRSQLRCAGYTFHTSTDTEVLLAAYLEWGTDCLQHFNGMWSFAIFDERCSTIFCARDRFGVKPFYFADTQGAFVFGSEIRQLLYFLDRRVPDQELVKDFLVTGLTDHTNRTFFSGIQKLEPGQMLQISSLSGEFSVSKFYRPQLKIESLITSNDAALKIRALLEDSVRLRLRSDIRVGSCLSGGLDSSILTAIGSKNESGDNARPFYSITATSEYHPNEEYFAGLVSHQCELEWHTIKPSYDDFSSNLDGLIEAQEEPFAGPSVMMQYLVMRHAQKDGTSVLLDGQGADEIFLGYNRYLPMWLMWLLSREGFISFLRAIRSVLKAPSIVTTRGLLVYSLGGSSVRIRELFYRVRYPFLKDKKLPGALTSLTRNRRDPHEVQNIEINLTSLPMLLRFEDKNSMRFSIETRLPFLDFRLVEFALSLPVTAKIAKGWLKWPLRNAMHDMLPGEVRWRRDKIGFAAPEESWLTLHGDKMRTAILRSQFVRHFVDMDVLDRKFSSVDRKMKWRLYCLALWADKFQVTPE